MNWLMRTRKLAVALLAVAVVLLLPARALGDATGTATPVASPNSLVLGECSTRPARVLVGQRFTLVLPVSNRSKYRLDNVVVTVGAASVPTAVSAATAEQQGTIPPFAVLGSGSVRTLGNIEGHGRRTTGFAMIVDPRAAPGSYVVPISIEYGPAEARSVVQTSLGVVVVRDASFYIRGLENTITVEAGGSASVKVEAVNSGTFTVPGVSLTLSGNGVDVAEGSMFVGALAQGDGDVLQSRVTARDQGEHELLFTLHYTDDYGRAQQMQRTARLVVTQARPAGAANTTSAHAGWLQGLLGFLGGLLGLGR